MRTPALASRAWRTRLRFCVSMRVNCWTRRRVRLRNGRQTRIHHGLSRGGQWRGGRAYGWRFMGPPASPLVALQSRKRQTPLLCFRHLRLLQFLDALLQLAAAGLQELGVAECLEQQRLDDVVLVDRLQPLDALVLDALAQPLLDY